MIRRLCLLFLAVAACTEERARPGPVDPDPTDPALVAEVLTPPSGATIPTGQDITVRVRARSNGPEIVRGIGYIARVLAPGMPVIATDTIRFEARADTTHEFIMQIPDTIPTNTQLDIYGIAVSGVVPLLSEPAYTTVVRCQGGVC